MNIKELNKFEELITSLMQSSKIPSIAINVIEKDKIIYSKAFGSRKIKGNVKATPDTLYGIGSVTKSFTCLAIMQLAEKKKLDINDPIEKYLPIKLGKKDNPITIHHLMSHSSGIPNLGVATVLISRHSFEEKETYVPLSSFEDFMLFINSAKEEVQVEPGSRYYYYNAGYVLLGLIIEKITNMKFEEYIRENILVPLGMNRSTFTFEGFEKEEDKMSAYKTEKDKVLQETIHPFDPLIYAAGGLLSSVNELSNYLQMYLNEGKINEKVILESDLLKKMFNPYIERQPSNFGKESYAYGWGITEDFFGERLIHHGGSTAVSSAFLAMIPNKKIAVAIAGNVGNSMGGLISQAILAIFLGKNPQEDHPIFRMEKKLSILAGDYQTYKGLNKISIIKDGLMLFGKLPDNDSYSFQLVPRNDRLDDFNFWIPIGNIEFPVEFSVDEKTSKIDMHYERNIYHKKN